jgi:hypothetical protein
MTHLTEQVLAAVSTQPYITSNGVCRKLKARKADVLTELERLRRERLLRFEHGRRGSKCWYLVAGRGNQFLTCSRGTPEGIWEAASARRRHAP